MLLRRQLSLVLFLYQSHKDGRLCWFSSVALNSDYLPSSLDIFTPRPVVHHASAPLNRNVLEFCQDVIELEFVLKGVDITSKFRAKRLVLMRWANGGSVVVMWKNKPVDDVQLSNSWKFHYLRQINRRWFCVVVLNRRRELQALESAVIRRTPCAVGADAHRTTSRSRSAPSADTQRPSCVPVRILIV